MLDILVGKFFCITCNVVCDRVRFVGGFFNTSLCIFILLLNWEKWKLLEIFICVVNRKGWSQDRQGSQEGLHNPLPAWL